MKQRHTIPFIGIYDVFSASVAAKSFDSLFISGFGFAASHYGLPDIGFIAWSDVVSFVQRVRAVLPDHLILVDMDDGYGDPQIACHVVAMLEAAGASGIVLEDQRRPRRCGHFAGKQLLAVNEFQDKLAQVLAHRQDLFVVARTDAEQVEEVLARTRAYAEVGPDAILVDAVRDLELIGRLHDELDVPFAFNQIAGGKSPPCDLARLESLGVGIVIYSTPCLFAAQQAMQAAMRDLQQRHGQLPSHGVGVHDCTQLLQANLQRRRSSESAAA